MEDQDRTISSISMNNKASDSGYGSNKSNSHSQSQTSFGSSKSKSQHSSLSSRSFESRQNASASNSAEQQHLSPAQQATGNASVGPKRTKEHKKSKSKGVPVTAVQAEQSTLQAQPHQHIHLSQELKPALPVNAEQNMTSGIRSGSTQPSSPAAAPPRHPHDTKVLQMAALTRALSCMKKFSDEGGGIGIFKEDSTEDPDLPTAIHLKWQGYFENYLKEETGTSILEVGFITAVSMEDGVVVHMTPSITNVLGFPKDMWIGRSFIDFVHPKDRMAFASHIASGLSFPVEVQNINSQRCSRTVNSEPFFCRLRQYRGLTSTGFAVVDKPCLFFPFKLTMKLKEIDLSQWPSVSEDKENGRTENMAPVVHLIIVATRVKSAYQYPEQVPPPHAGKFVTRHSATCNFGHIDTDAISYLGHLPQDLIGNSILDYYHPEDMLQMRSIYEGVMMEQGKPFRSKPYRFKAFNGTFALLETDWSCFINPWSGKLEFVIGQHRVVKGPPNPNVFMQPKEEDSLRLLDEVAYDCKVIQEDIKKLLTETVSRRLSDPLRHQSTRRRKDLAALMESLLEQMAKTENSVKSGSQCSGLFSVMARDSVMLGRLSPHHDGKSGSGSNQSSETAPSYSQLNYRENIERFFQSQPKTSRSDEPPEKMETNRSSTDEENKGSALLDYSSGSNNRISSGSNGSGEGENFENCCLTEDLLSRHNDNMEKCMVQRHREHRVKTNTSAAASHKDKQIRKKRRISYDQTRPQSAPKRADSPTLQRLKKRGTNPGWPVGSAQPKLPHLDHGVKGKGPSIPRSAPPACHAAPRPTNTLNLWPPFSISIPPNYSAPTYSAAGLQPGIENYRYFPQGSIPTPIAGQPLLNHRIHLRAPIVLVAGTNQHQYLQQPVQYAVPSAVMPIYPTLSKPGDGNDAVGSRMQVIGQHIPVNQFSAAGLIQRPALPMQQFLISPHLIHNPHAVPSTLPVLSSGRMGSGCSAPHLPNPTTFQSRITFQPSFESGLGAVSSSAIPMPSASTYVESNQLTSRTQSPISGIRLAPTIGSPHKTSQPQQTNNSNKRNQQCLSTSDGSSSRDGTLEDSFSFSLSSYVKNGQSDENDSMSLSFSCQTKDSSGDDTDQSAPNNAQPTAPNKPSKNSSHQMPGGSQDVSEDKYGYKAQQQAASKGPLCLDEGNLTADVRLRFQLPCGDLTEILRNDLIVMKLFEQPPVVNQQLEQLYTELDAEGTPNELQEDSSGSETHQPTRKYDYAKLGFIHEANAFLPPTELSTSK